MFGKKKSLPEKALTKLGDLLDGHVMDIAKRTGTTIAGLVVAVVGSSAVVNAVREDEE